MSGYSFLRHPMRLRPALTIALACLAPASARALPPDQIFDRVAPGVWSVKAYSAEEKLLASASGIVVAPGKLVTSCQVLARARQVQLRRGNSIFDAKLEFPDVERDLCQLDVPGLAAPALAVGSARALKPGQRLYVVGFARGNEQSIGEGLVSRVSEAGSSKERIETTVPASAGLLGAGVFDEEAQLVGLITSSPANAAASAFAVPADWLAELAARGQAVLAARVKPAAKTGSSREGMPAAGSQWVYGFIDRQYSRRQIDVTVRVMRVNGSLIDESVAFSGSSDVETQRSVSAGEARFFTHRFANGAELTEFAPYFLAANGEKSPAIAIAAIGYPVGSPSLPGFTSTAQIQGWEQVTVPAGTFRALRVEMAGNRRLHFLTRDAVAGRFKLTVWYAPEVRRFVRLEHMTWSAYRDAPAQLNHDVVELLSFRPPS